MPKLDGTHLPQRLAERLADLRAGKEVAARDLNVLLNNEQIAEMEAACDLPPFAIPLISWKSGLRLI